MLGPSAPVREQPWESIPFWLHAVGRITRSAYGPTRRTCCQEGMVQAVDIIGPEFTGQECAPLSIGGLSTRPGPLAVFADEPVADPINVADRGFQRLQDCHEPYEIRGLEVGNDVEVTRFEIYSVHPCGS